MYTSPLKKVDSVDISLENVESKHPLKQNGGLVTAPKIGLALSGGVMRGPTHLGVLSVLEREGIPIECITGASVGSLVGALYCAGIPLKELFDITANMNWFKVARPVLSKNGFVSFDKMETWLAEIMGDLTFADLKRPFAIVATDLEEGIPVVFTEGRLIPAIRASCSVPGFITPTLYKGRLLGDGGVSNNLPVSLAKELGATYVIGVDLFVPTTRRPLGPLRFGLAALETLVRQSGGGLNQADCLIKPNLAGVTYINPAHYQKLINLGIEATEAKLPVLEAVLKGTT